MPHSTSAGLTQALCPASYRPNSRRRRKKKNGVAESVRQSEAHTQHRWVSTHSHRFGWRVKKPYFLLWSLILDTLLKNLTGIRKNMIRSLPGKLGPVQYLSHFTPNLKLSPVLYFLSFLSPFSSRGFLLSPGECAQVRAAYAGAPVEVVRRSPHCLCLALSWFYVGFVLQKDIVLSPNSPKQSRDITCPAGQWPLSVLMLRGLWSTLCPPVPSPGLLRVGLPDPLRRPSVGAG